MSAKGEILYTAKSSYVIFLPFVRYNSWSMSVDFCLTTSSNTTSMPLNAKTVITIVIYVGSDFGIKSRKMSVKKHMALES